VISTAQPPGLVCLLQGFPCPKRVSWTDMAMIGANEDDSGRVVLLPADASVGSARKYEK
jgi:hypothetical protein